MEIVIYMKPKHGEEEQFNKIENAFNKHCPKAKWVEREKINSKMFEKNENNDIIFVIGGDGTFLKVSHFVKNQLIFGVNLNPEKKEGFFMGSSPKNIEEKLSLIKQGKYKVEELNRLHGTVDGNKLPKALNEYYIGHKKPYLMSYYIIEIEGKKEFQKSSGVLISTACGSHSWVHSAGGEKLEKTSKQMQFLVREPYVGTLNKINLTQGITTKEIKIISKLDNIIIAVDSLNIEIPLNKDKELIIKDSDEPLRTISV